MRAGPGQRHASIQNTAETARDEEDAHIDVDHECAYGHQSSDAMGKDHDRHKPMRSGGDAFRKPHEQSCNQQHECTVIHDPVKLLLTVVKLVYWRKLVITIRDVSFNVLAPLPVLLRDLHAAFPDGVHPELDNKKGKAKPWMPEADDRSTAEDIREPIQIRRKQSQAAQEQVNVCNRRAPVAQTLSERVANNFSRAQISAMMVNYVATHCDLPSPASCPHRWALVRSGHSAQTAPRRLDPWLCRPAI